MRLRRIKLRKRIYSREVEYICSVVRNVIKFIWEKLVTSFCRDFGSIRGIKDKLETLTYSMQGVLYWRDRDS